MSVGPGHNPTKADALAVVDTVPRTTAELYLKATGLPADMKVTTAHRRARARLGTVLEHLAREGVINRGVIADPNARPFITFWRVDAAG